MLRDKVIVITGGAGLLGAEFCAAVAKNHGIAIVADTNIAGAERVADGLRSAGGRAEAIALDITSPASVQQVIADLAARHGRIDAVVNNAYPRNAQWGQALEQVSYQDFCENVNLHLGGYFLVSQQFAMYFRERKSGQIINMASIYGVMSPRFEIYTDAGMTFPVEYAAIKAGVIHLTKYFAKYFMKDGVRVNSISPGGILDAQPESFLERYNANCGTKGMLDTTDVSGTLVFLLSDAADRITGQNLVVDDGFSL